MMAERKWSRRSGRCGHPGTSAGASPRFAAHQTTADGCSWLTSRPENNQQINYSSTAYSYEKPLGRERDLQRCSGIAIPMPISHHCCMRPGRLVASAIAVLICIGFLVGARQAHEAAGLTAVIVKGELSSHSQQTSAASMLRAARFGYPGQDVPILAARVALVEHRYSHAAAIARGVTRAEPDNLEGWILLAGALLGDRDQRGLRHVQEGIARLDPVDARAG
jgi:hypothetical protein